MLRESPEANEDGIFPRRPMLPGSSTTSPHARSPPGNHLHTRQPFHEPKSNIMSMQFMHRTRRFIYQWPAYFWWGIVFCLLLLLFTRMPSPSPRPQKQKYEILFTHDLVQYQDTTEMTDYQLLDRLLKPDYAEHPKQFNREERTPGWVANIANSPLSKQLQQKMIRGHSSREVDQLSQAVSIPFVDERSRTVPVTAIMYFTAGTTRQQSLDQQLQAVLSQSVVVETVWIVCDSETRSQVEDKVAALANNNKRQQVEAVVWEPIEWRQLALRAPSDYVWIISENVIPGKKYLERMLRLSLVDGYQQALLGTQAISFKLQQNSGLECTGDFTETGELPNMTQVVDMIDDIWLVRRSWLGSLAPDVILHQDQRLFGYSLSRSLAVDADIPSIIIPTLSDNVNYNVKYSAGHSLQEARSNLCNSIRDHLTNIQSKGTAWREAMLIPGRFDSSIVFIIDGIQQFHQFKPLICEFVQNQHADIHVITTGDRRGLSPTNLMESLTSYNPTCASRVRVHDLNVGYGRHVGVTVDDGSVFFNENIHDLTRLITVLKPRVIIHMAHNGPVLKGIQATHDITKVPTIALPPRDVRHAFWMARLPVLTLERWHDFSLKLVVVTDRRPEALARLLRSAARAHYFGDSVDLAIVMEQSSDRVTQAFVNSLPWPHGTKDLRHRITKVNQMPIHVEAWYPGSDHEYAILLDESIELSEMFYEWAKYAILKYRYSPGTPKEAAYMMGVSLYSPRIIENDPRERRLFDPAQALLGGGFNPRTPYLMQAVTSAGAVFFPEHWREFHDYIGARLADMNRNQLQNITIPNARSSQWVNSWRRYMDEMMYMRAYMMLYPNFENYVSLSTYHFEPGNHVTVDFSQAASLLRVPLMDGSVSLRQELPGQRLPDWQQFPLLDMWGNLQEMVTLREIGRAFQRQGSSCTPLALNQHMHDPSDMLCPFAKLIEVPVTSEHDPVPEFGTRVVAVIVPSSDETKSEVQQ